jgi:hypothetical protein
MPPSRIGRTLILTFALPILVACAAPLDAQIARAEPLGAPLAPPSDSGRVSRGRFLASFPLAVVLGTAGGVGGALAGYAYLGCEDEGSYCEHGPDNGEVLIAAAGLALGAAAGAFLGGLRADSRGRFWADLLAPSGGALLVGMAAVNDPENGGPVIVAGLVAAPLAAAITDHFVRKGRGPRRVSIQPNPFLGPLGLSVTVRM